MATSELYTYSINRDELIKASHRVLGVFNDDAIAPPTDMGNAAQALNLMIKQWMQEGYPLWTVATLEVPLLVDQFVYTLGPQGSLDTYRPLRVIDARLKYENGLEVPLQQLSAEEYRTLTNKGARSVANSFYYDPQTIRGKLYVWPVAGELGASIILTVQRPLMDMANSTDTFDFPVECLNAIKFGLAAELIEEYETPEPKASRIIARAEKLKDAMFDSSVEEASVYFSPDFR